MAIERCMAEGAPELSVVVVTYNCRDLVLDCLRSLDEQAGVTPEVILVDNASDDGTPQVVSASFGEVAVIASRANLGFAKSNNRGIAAARGRYVLLLNPDTILPPGVVRMCLDALSVRPGVGMLGVKLVRADGTLDHACKRGAPDPLGSLVYLLRLDRFAVLRRLSGSYRAADLGEDTSSEVDAISGAFMLVRREAMDEVGLLDERFWMYGEDLDWCKRFWDAGWPVFYWSKCWVLHLKGGSSGQRRGAVTNRAFHQAMWLYFAKHGSPQRLLRLAVRGAINVRFSLTELRSGRMPR